MAGDEPKERDYGSNHAPHSKDDANRRAWKAAETKNGGPVIHVAPPEGGGLMPCCGKTPLEVPRWHRMTMDKDLVNCNG